MTFDTWFHLRYNQCNYVLTTAHPKHDPDQRVTTGKTPSGISGIHMFMPEVLKPQANRTIPVLARSIKLYSSISLERS